MRINLESFYEKLKVGLVSSETTVSSLIQSRQAEFDAFFQSVDNDENLEVFLSSKIGWLNLASFSQGKVGNQNLFGPHELVIFHRYEKWIAEHKIKNPIFEVCFLDLGANVGVHGIVFSKLAGDSDHRILCVEPNDKINQIRILNFNSNNITRATHLSAAVVPDSFQPESVEFIECIDNLTASTTVLTNKQIYGNARSVSVTGIRTRQLFNLTPMGNPENLLIIKLDIEGAEADFLEDALPIILSVSECNVKIAVEVSSQENAARIFKLLENLDNSFTVYSDLAGLSSTIRSISEVPNRWSQGSLYLEFNNYLS